MYPIVWLPCNIIGPSCKALLNPNLNRVLKPELPPDLKFIKNYLMAIILYNLIVVKVEGMYALGKSYPLSRIIVTGLLYFIALQQNVYSPLLNACKSANCKGLDFQTEEGKKSLNILSHPEWNLAGGSWHWSLNWLHIGGVDFKDVHYNFTEAEYNDVTKIIYNNLKYISIVGPSVSTRLLGVSKPQTDTIPLLLHPKDSTFSQDNTVTSIKVVGDTEVKGVYDSRGKWVEGFVGGPITDPDEKYYGSPEEYEDIYKEETENFINYRGVSSSSDSVAPVMSISGQLITNKPPEIIQGHVAVLLAAKESDIKKVLVASGNPQKVSQVAKLIVEDSSVDKEKAIKLIRTSKDPVAIASAAAYIVKDNLEAVEDIAEASGNRLAIVATLSTVSKEAMIAATGDPDSTNNAIKAAKRGKIKEMSIIIKNAKHPVATAAAVVVVMDNSKINKLAAEASGHPTAVSAAFNVFNGIQFDAPKESLFDGDATNVKPYVATPEEIEAQTKLFSTQGLLAGGESSTSTASSSSTTIKSVEIPDVEYDINIPDRISPTTTTQTAAKTGILTWLVSKVMYKTDKETEEEKEKEKEKKEKKDTARENKLTSSDKKSKPSFRDRFSHMLENAKEGSAPSTPPSSTFKTVFFTLLAIGVSFVSVFAYRNRKKIIQKMRDLFDEYTVRRKKVSSIGNWERVVIKSPTTRNMKKVMDKVGLSRKFTETQDEIRFLAEKKRSPSTRKRSRSKSTTRKRSRKKSHRRSE